MTRAVAALLLSLQLLLAACSATASPAPSRPPVPTPSPAASGTPRVSTPPGPTGPLTQAQLKVRLIDHYGPLWYCDPDAYPVARDDEQALALRAWPQVMADAEALAAIRAQWGITAPDPTDTDRLAIYHEWKMLRAIALDPVSTGRWRFDYLPQPVTPSSAVTRTIGTIDAHGTIVVQRTEPGQAPNCPICLARGQLIDTPRGPVPVELLAIGDPVWTLDREGRPIVGIVIAIGSTRVPAGHEMVHLATSGGSSVIASAGHPLPDGRRVGDLRPGDVVDGVIVVAAERIAYLEEETFDLLASGPTGAYRIDGTWLASTLGR